MQSVNLKKPYHNKFSFEFKYVRIMDETDANHVVKGKKE